MAAMCMPPCSPDASLPSTFRDLPRPSRGESVLPAHMRTFASGLVLTCLALDIARLIGGRDRRVGAGECADLLQGAFGRSLTGSPTAPVQGPVPFRYGNGRHVCRATADTAGAWSLACTRRAQAPPDPGSWSSSRAPLLDRESPVLAEAKRPEYLVPAADPARDRRQSGRHADAMRRHRDERLHPLRQRAASARPPRSDQALQPRRGDPARRRPDPGPQPLPSPCPLRRRDRSPAPTASHSCSRLPCRPPLSTQTDPSR
jgi:hypothetical protein